MNRIRRDPRDDRERQRIAPGGARPRFDVAAPKSHRPRRNPRAERDGAAVPGRERVRIDRQQPSGQVAAVRTPVPETVLDSSARVHVVECPAYWVLVVADPDGLSAHDRQTIGAARKIAGLNGGVVLLADREVADAGKSGADRIVRIAQLEHPAARARAVATLIEVLAPRHILAPETSDGGDLVRRLAATARERFFGGVHQVVSHHVTRTVRSRAADQSADTPRFLTIAADSFAPHSGDLREARALELPRPEPDSWPEPERLRPEASALPLGEADFVVAAGNGVTDLEAFKRLAAALGATPGASRVLCDSGLMPRESQVGASGSVLAARFYLALGIAGAPQHLQGIAGCEHVLAVNTDLHAAMVDRAELAIVADAQAVMPALLALLASEAT